MLTKVREKTAALLGVVNEECIAALVREKALQGMRREDRPNIVKMRLLRDRGRLSGHPRKCS
jgi:hypothetical protein